MAGSAFSGVGSPTSANEHHNPEQDWEILSASTLLAQGHGLGFGLPPLSTPSGLHASRVDGDGISPGHADSGPELDFIFRGNDLLSLPLDASQIAAVSATSTSSVEPFTEGWKPQYRIAGAPLKENYCARDPFAPASQTRGSSDSFLNMDRRSTSDLSRAAADEMMNRHLRPEKEPGLFHLDYYKRGVKQGVSPQHQEDYSALDKGIETGLAKPDALDSSKSSIKTKCAQETMRLWRKGQGLCNRNSYVTWSIALSTVLLGVFFITYCSKRGSTTSVHELSASDEALARSG